MTEPVWFKFYSKYRDARRVGFAHFRRAKIEKENFTIISNNCWGGMIYESYNLIKQSPTVGLYILPKDYLKFIENLSEYLNYDLNFISPSNSKNKDYIKEYIKDEKFGTYPIGQLNDIEIYFLHYKSESEAYQKWNRRIKRIEWDRLLFKFNDQNGCTNDDIKKFCNLKLDNKVCFTVRDGFEMYENVYKIKNPLKEDHVNTFVEPFGESKILNVNELIKNL